MVVIPANNPAQLVRVRARPSCSCSPPATAAPLHALSRAFRRASPGRRAPWRLSLLQRGLPTQMPAGL
ncbi:hypothetical protein GUJ93_ZPchr0002g26591 [Zizania palustris]|uniref:Uncharacterized protein n=1 Tax=Zizania palustris TaxID=103762 RepID=A0A8J5RM44_ZIZPA|nr:hypothetical protein GUJ93_ZPchr0002g26591 [Zizania palustris]